jgi:hypothetical protein
MGDGGGMNPAIGHHPMLNSTQKAMPHHVHMR